MKKYLFLATFFSLAANAIPILPHIMPDLQGQEYRELLQNKSIGSETQTNSANKITSQRAENTLNVIIQFGARNLAWLDHINSSRVDKITFSTPENRRTYPISSPSIYNKTIVINNYNNLLKELPSALTNVLLGNEPFTDDVPIALDEYLHYALLIDYVYQSAARWMIMEPNLYSLKAARSSDIRGYYNLENTSDLNEKLINLNSLELSVQNQLKVWLLEICYNTERSDAKCQNKFDQSIEQNNGNATIFYNTYINRARKIYSNFFVIPSYASRDDIVWTRETPLIAHIPFANVADNLKSFLHNIELEWQWDGWHLVLDYVERNNVPYLKFEPGTTPHVNFLGGNQIVMDANLALDEWDNQWTIRHEFGHVLGFPDCYIEFFDESLDAIVNYQLDVSNLMCSRKGRLQEGHFLEMKKNYYTNLN